MLIGAVLSAAQASLIAHADPSQMRVSQASANVTKIANDTGAEWTRSTHCAGLASPGSVDKGLCNFHCQSVHQADSHAEVPAPPFAPQPAILIAGPIASTPLALNLVWLHTRGTPVPSRILLGRLLI
ncbi:MAG TPA: hypothetical protein VGR65_10340 [Casimicrobiaceae bacterium]|jgi:hypothetical protein|nr:hypothetical protein [Casimicrobiaceae bacterium]